MERVILRVSQSVEIDAPPAAVFALVADAPASARLNPLVQVVRIERETPGPLREGSIRRELRAWLQAIKHHLESSRQDSVAEATGN